MTESRREKLARYLGTIIEVTTLRAEYEFSKSFWRNQYREDQTITGGRYVLKSVDEEGIATEQSTGIIKKEQGTPLKQRIPFSSESRGWRRDHLPPEGNLETYTLTLITQIKWNGKTIYHRELEERLPAEVKKKCRKYQYLPSAL